MGRGDAYQARVEQWLLAQQTGISDWLVRRRDVEELIAAKMFPGGTRFRRSTRGSVG